MLFYGAKIYTMESAVYEHGYLRVDHSVITDVGDMQDLELLPEEESCDVSGKIITPGFIDAHTHLGMWEDSLGFEGDDGNEDSDPVTPHLRAVDAVNPSDRAFIEALSAGITTVVTGPGSANPIGGQMLAMKTMGRRIDEMLVKEPVAVKLSLGENPKTTYKGKDEAPVTRMATAALIRESFYKAKRYLDSVEKAKADPDKDLPEYDSKSEALLPVLRGELPVHIHAHRADDIFTAIRICREFGLRYVLIHATEGYMITGSLKDEGAQVVLGPLLSDRSKPEVRNLSITGPGIIDAANIPFALCSDHPENPVQYLPLTAGLCVKNDLDYYSALAAITKIPAAILGIDYRVGSLAPGKDADFLVFGDDPLLSMERPEMVFVEGKQAGE